MLSIREILKNILFSEFYMSLTFELIPGRPYNLNGLDYKNYRETFSCVGAMFVRGERFKCADTGINAEWKVFIDLYRSDLYRVRFCECDIVRVARCEPTLDLRKIVHKLIQHPKRDGEEHTQQVLSFLQDSRRLAEGLREPRRSALTTAIDAAING